jgi:hypothetical protein
MNKCILASLLVASAFAVAERGQACGAWTWCACGNECENNICVASSSFWAGSECDAAGPHPFAGAYNPPTWDARKLLHTSYRKLGAADNMGTPANLGHAKLANLAVANDQTLTATIPTHSARKMLGLKSTTVDTNVLRNFHDSNDNKGRKLYQKYGADCDCGGDSSGYGYKTMGYRKLYQKYSGDCDCSGDVSSYGIPTSAAGLGNMGIPTGVVYGIPSGLGSMSIPTGAGDGYGIPSGLGSMGIPTGAGGSYGIPSAGTMGVPSNLPRRSLRGRSLFAVLA